MSTKKIARSRSARNPKPLADASAQETRASAKATRAWLRAQTLENIAANVAHSRRAALEAVDVLAEEVALEQKAATEALYQLCQVLHGLQAIGSELRARGVEIPRGEP